MDEDLARFDYKETALFTLSEIVLPTADVFTDFILAFKFLTISYDNYVTETSFQCVNRSWSLWTGGCYINESYILNLANCNDPSNPCCLDDPPPPPLTPYYCCYPDMYLVSK